MNHELEIKKFIIAEFAPDITIDDIDADYDLLDGAVIDSMGLLKVIAWLEERFELEADDLDLHPDRFRTVNSIRSMIDDAQVGAK